MKRFLSCLLVAGMLLGLCVTTAFAADSDSSDTFSDVSSDTTSENWHWGGTAIERWADYDLVVGCGDGTFRPNNSMTRAEAAVVFAKLLGLTADDADLSFIADCTDVNESDWYAPYIALCYEYGIMAGTSTTSLTMNPTGTMSREMYMAMLVRVLKIAGADSIDEEAAGKSYSDADDVSDWAKKSVYALANLQYVSGTTTGEVGTLSAKSDMTRAEVMSLLNQTISAYTNSAYIEKTGGNTVTMETFDTGNGVTLIAAGNVKVTGSGDMFVAAGAAKGGTIEVTGTANTVINASDKTTVNFTVTEKESQVENTEIHGEDSSVNFIVPTGSSLTVASATSTGTGSITVSGAATAAAATITGENVTVTAANDSISVTADEATVTITESGLTVDGTASSVTTSGNTGTVTTASATISATTSAVTVAGTIATVEVTSDDATVTVADTATVNTVTVASSSEVTVDGTVSTVEVTSKDATVTVTDTATVETVTDSTSVTWNAPAFTWASDYSSATAAFTSTAGNTQTVTATVTSTTTAATSTAAGKTVYTATVTFNGITYINTKEVAIPATGHSYGTPVFTWASDYSSATAAFTCTAGDDTQTVTATVASSTTAATCTADGKTVYTATVTFNGSTYTDTKEVIIAATGHSYNADLTACSTCGEKIVTSSVVEDMEVSNYTVIQYMIPYEDGTVTIVLDDARLKASDGKSFAAFVSSSLINDMFMDVDGNADFTALTISIEIDTSDAEAIALGLTESTIEITLDLLVQNGNEIQLTTSTDANLTTDQLSALMVTDSTATTQNIPATSYLAGSGTKLTFKSDLIHLSDLVGTYNGDTGGYSTYLSSESYSGDGFTFYLAGGLRLKANYGGSSSYIALADFVKGVTVTSDGTLDTSNYDLYHNMYLDAYGYLIRMCG